MRKLIVGILSLTLSSVTLSQTPTSCFEIESILVDACGTPENGNEMVRFKVGPADLDGNNLTVQWPNNSWLGLTQNDTSAQAVAALNSTIQSCGYLVEPTNLILPAGSNVLLITSYNMDVTANSFTNLTDTLYVIFQNLIFPSNVGHFANYNSTPGIRTLVMSFNPPGGCADTVSYDRSLLIGGNGARADFAWNGTASYANDGCQAPVITNTISLSTGSSTTVCPGDVISLSATASGSYSEVIWLGNDGTFSSTNTLTNDYTAGAGDTVPFYIYTGLVNYCNDTLLDSIQVSINSGTITITPNTYDLCPGESVTLTASGGSNYTWSTSQTGPSITVNSAGTYTVSGIAGCTTVSATSTITANGTLPNAVISGDSTFCSGDFASLTASGGDTYIWSTGATQSTASIGFPGQIWVAASTACGTDTAYITTVDLGAAPSLSLSGDTIICSSTPVNITASGADTYSWSTGATTNSSSIDSAGVYYVAGATNCGNDTIYFTVLDGTLNAGFTMSTLSHVVPYNVVFTNTSTNADSYSWDFGNGSTSTQTDPNTNYTIAGTYTVTLTATNAYGCSDIATSTFVGTNSEVVFPNIFSPNNDQSNDHFYINPAYLVNVVKMDIQIYNRWGQKMGQITDLNGTWDGRTMSGEAVPDGTYFYTAIITYTGDEVKNYDGSFLLVR